MSIIRFLFKVIGLLIVVTAIWIVYLQVAARVGVPDSLAKPVPEKDPASRSVLQTRP